MSSQVQPEMRDNLRKQKLHTEVNKQVNSEGLKQNQEPVARSSYSKKVQSHIKKREAVQNFRKEGQKVDSSINKHENSNFIRSRYENQHITLEQNNNALQGQQKTFENYFYQKLINGRQLAAANVDCCFAYGGYYKYYYQGYNYIYSSYQYYTYAQYNNFSSFSGGPSADCDTQCLSVCSCSNNTSCFANCTNEPPYLNDSLPTTVVLTMQEGTSKYYYLPTKILADDTLILSKHKYIHISPFWASLESQTQGVYYLSPPQGSAFATYAIVFNISDGAATNGTFSFNITVVPRAVFNPSPSQQYTYAGTPLTYTLPNAIDLENNTISLTFNGVSLTGSYITFTQPNILNINPSFDDYGSSYAYVSLTNPYGITKYSLGVTVYNDPPKFATIPLNQTAKIGKTVEYQWPLSSDREGNNYTLYLTPTATWYSCNMTHFKIMPTIAQTGIYTLKVYLDDAKSYKYYSITITILPNSAPNFNTTIITNSITEGQNLVYTLPGVTDPDVDTCTISMIGTSSLVNFTSPNILNFHPPLYTTPGSYSITVKITDGINFPNFTVNFIVVKNSPPTFVTALVNQTIYAGSTTTYILPATIDVDGDTNTISLESGGPSCVTFISPNILNISPLLTDASVGTVTTQVRVTDFLGYTDYFIGITVTNTAPIFNTVLANQNLIPTKTIYYLWPSQSDSEGHSVILSLSPAATWYSYNSTYLTMMPSNSEGGNTFTLTVTLSDTFLTRDHTLQIIVALNAPPQFASSLVTLQVIQGLTFSYTFPVVTDVEDDVTTISMVSTSTLVSFTSPNILDFHPPISTTVGTYSINVKISDGINNPTFTVNFQVTKNYPPTFVTTPVSQSTPAGSSIIYTLPATQDNESEVVTISMLSGGPQFVTFNNPNTISISPSLTDALAGSQTIQISLDTNTGSTIYQININVTNTPPTFASNPSNQNSRPLFTLYYQWPSYSDAEGHSIVMTVSPSASWYSFNETYLTMIPTNAQASQTFNLIVTLTDSYLSQIYPMQIIITPNAPPSFSTSLVTQSVTQGLTSSYTLPAVTDMENEVCTISMVGSSPVATFSSPDIVNIAPGSIAVGIYTITIKISDSINNPTFTLSIDVTPNTPPTFDTAPVTQSTPAGVPITYSLPSYSDVDGNTVILSLVAGGPSFVTLTLPNTLNISPALSNVGSTSVQVTLFDGIGTTSYTITIIVTNTAPIFQSSLSDQSVIVGKTLQYPWPTQYDAEGHSMAISLSPTAAWYSISSTHLTIAPTLAASGEIVTLTVSLTDTFNPSTYTMQITAIPNTAPIFVGDLVDQLVSSGTTQNYGLPATYDYESDPITISLGIGTPNFITYSSGVVKISPLITQQVKAYTVTVKVADAYGSTHYQFKVTLANTPPFFMQPINNLVINVGTVQNYKFPEIFDAEGQPVTMTVLYNNSLTLPGFVNYDDVNKTFIATPLDKIDSGFYILSITLSDGSLSNSYQLQMKINHPPKFAEELKDQMIQVNEFKAYQIPTYSDSDGESLTFSTVKYSSTSLPSFMKYYIDNRTYVMHPQSQNVGQFRIAVLLNDGYTTSIFNFIVMVNQVITVPSITNTIANTTDQSSQGLIIRVNDTVVTPIAASSDSNQQVSNSIQQLDSLIDEDVVISGSANQSVISNGSSSGIATFKAAQPKFKFMIDKKTGARVKISINYVSISILKVTKDQLATLRLSSDAIDISETIKQVSQKSLELSVIQQNGDSYQIKFLVQSKDISAGLINIQLQYPNPSNLSNSQIPDKLQVKVISNIQTMRIPNLIKLPIDSIASSNIPLQLTSQTEIRIMSNLQNGRITFSASSIKNICIGVSVQFIWFLFEDISFLTTNSLISIQIPGIPSTIQQVLYKLVFFDIFFTEFWFQKFMTRFGLDLDNIPNDEAININFSENGYDSKHFLNNAGSTFLYIVLLIACWCIFLIFAFISLFFKNLKPKRIKIEEYMWDLSLTLLFTQFTPMMFCVLINLYGRNYKEKLVETANLSQYFAIVVLIALLGAILSIFLKIWSLSKNYSGKKVRLFKKDFGKIFENLRVNRYSKKLVLLWRPIYLTRWALTVVVLLSCQSSPATQILILLILSIIYQSLILLAKPYVEQERNIICFINEFSVSIDLYLTLLLTNFTEPIIQDAAQLNSFRLLVAWVMTGLILLVIGINFIYGLKNFIVSVSRPIKLWQMRRERRQQYEMEKIRQSELTAAKNENIRLQLEEMKTMKENEIAQLREMKQRKWMVRTERGRWEKGLTNLFEIRE